MSSLPPTRALFLITAAALAGACGGSDGTPACSPTDPACNPTDRPTPLAVNAVTPASATGTATFSEAVDPASVTSTSFSVGGAPGTIDVDGATATFAPNDSFEPDASA